MKYKSLLAGLVFSVLCMKSSMARADTFPVFDVEQTKKEITLQLSKNLAGSPHAQPIILLVGGFPGSGKTTLINALSEKHDITVISWNAIRQALLDRRLQGSPYDGEIIDSVHQNLLRLCMQRHINVVIDANAHARTIREIESFLEKEQNGQAYTVVKICLNPPIETNFSRIRARQQIEGIHQGTETDLQRDLNSSKKKIDLNAYALVINTAEISFETELNVVNAFLEPYLLNRL